MERETDTGTQKGGAHKAQHIPKCRPRNAGNEIQYEILLLCTVGRAELCIATGAQPKPRGGHLEVIGTEILNWGQK